MADQGPLPLINSAGSFRNDLDIYSRPVTPRRETAVLLSAETSSGVTSREVRSISEAQGRLVRVIEEVSQELTQRLKGHDVILNELQQKCMEESTRHSAFVLEFQRSRADESARLFELQTELARLRSVDGDVGARRAQNENEVSNLKRLHGETMNVLGAHGETMNVLGAKFSELHQQFQQLQQHLTVQFEGHETAIITGQQQLRDESARCDTELTELLQLHQQLKQQMATQVDFVERIATGQQQLRNDSERRDMELAKFQDAAERLARTAIERAQGGKDVEAKLAMIEKNVSELQRQDTDRRRTRIAKLKAELAHSPVRTQDSSGDLATCEERQGRVLDEVAEFRRSSFDLTMRVATCERDLGELRREFVGAGFRRNLVDRKELATHSSEFRPGLVERAARVFPQAQPHLMAPAIATSTPDGNTTPRVGLIGRMGAAVRTPSWAESSASNVEPGAEPGAEPAPGPSALPPAPLLLNAEGVSKSAVGSQPMNAITPSAPEGPRIRAQDMFNGHANAEQESAGDTLRGPVFYSFGLSLSEAKECAQRYPNETNGGEHHCATPVTACTNFAVLPPPKIAPDSNNGGMQQ